MSALVPALPADWYFRDDVYRRERVSVFGREWLYFASLDELAAPGDFVNADVAGYNIAVMVDAGGALRAFHNVCRHRGAPLLVVEQDTAADEARCRGHRRCGPLVCPYHGWSYSEEGKLIGAPHLDVAGGALPDLALTRVQLAVHRGLVFINLDEGAAPFATAHAQLIEALAPYPLERYRLHSRVVREGRFNWKTWVDGYQECYHCPTIHPVFKRDFKLGEYVVETRERFSVHGCPRRDDDASPSSSAAASASGDAEGLWLWVHPHIGMPCYAPGFYTLQVLPTSSTTTRLVYSFRFPVDAAADVIDEFKRFVVQVTDEDVAICERVQRNLQSGALAAGVLNPRRENGVAYFHSLLRTAVGSVP